MDLNLRNKRAFISGSSNGIGFAIARCLAKEGAIVTLNSDKSDLTEKAVNAIKREIPNCKIGGITADLSTSEGSVRVFEELDSVDILVNNLGIYEPKNFLEMNDDEWYRIININVMSSIRLTRHYLTKMLQNGWGRVIFISSESGVVIPKEMIHYGVTKTMMIALARGVAELTEGTEVTVNSLIVGPTRTGGVEKFINDLSTEWNLSAKEVEKKYFEKVRPGSLINRFLHPEEIANLVVYLSSPVSSATNGAALRADGGIVKSII